MKWNHLALLAVLSIATTPALASFDGRQCNRISDVSVPYEVSETANGLRFKSGDTDVIVTREHIQLGDRTYQDASVQGYYVDLRNFLDNAGSMAKVARSFLQRGPMAKAAMDMCQAILAVHESGRAIEQQFSGFTTPVQVKLKP